MNRLLPAAFSEMRISQDLGQAIFEPSPQAVLDNVADKLVDVQLWQAYLESQASEQSARMMAMKTASDNAGDLIDDLTLAANTARQAAITQELAEITGGAEAMK
jgi:F-type H+-transporting ATPase subunit gamma